MGIDFTNVKITDEMLAAMTPEQREPWLKVREREEEQMGYVEAAAQERNFSRALVLVDSKERARYLLDFDRRFHYTDEEARDLIDQFWSVTEAWSGDEELRDGMYSLLERVAPIHVLGDPERPLPKDEWLTIYRGNLGEVPGEHLMSWSLDRGIAEFFARMGMSLRGQFLGMYRDDGIPSVWRGVVKRNKVLGYFDDRSEQEVVVDGHHVIGIELIAQAVRANAEEE